MTEDQVRDKARDILGLTDKDGVRVGVGQTTTFNQLGFSGVADKPDGWYLPINLMETAVVLETKAEKIPLGDKQISELLKNVKIVESKYNNVVGILYNGEDTKVYKGVEEYIGNGSETLQNIEYYISLFAVDNIDKERIYELTAKINNCLHGKFKIENLYHRMIFTACALVAKRYNALMTEGMSYSIFKNSIKERLEAELADDEKQNSKLRMLTEVFSDIKMGLNVDSSNESEQERIKTIIGEFIGWVTDISECINSDAWRGEDVMGIFFNEFNRYKRKPTDGQVFTPEHITDFMYKILEVNQYDKVLDATCGSGGFLVKSMANMIAEAGGAKTKRAKEIKAHQLYGIEFSPEIYALACANMLIHKDGKTNLEQMDARTEEAGKWIKKQDVTKVLMNPPFEKEAGCMKIVENVLNNVSPGTPCGFILPDKKLEKTSEAQMKRILKRHRLRKIVKLPEDLFFGIGVTTSIFVFEAGIPQNDNEIFACWLKEDGLQTVKNKGRHDVRGLWSDIESRWVDIVRKQSGDDTCQWLKPSENLSYQTPQKPFEIFEEDFRKTAVDYVLFMRNIDTKKLKANLAEDALYGHFAKGD
ncbi:HsdM family class I SAM-dependent methyltransferase [Rothia mucilaginosa]